MPQKNGGVTFRVWAPFADSVAVMGDFNAWSKTENQLAKEKDGVWAVHIPQACVGQLYKYVITNGGQEFVRNDPRARQMGMKDHHSVIIDPTFDWGEAKHVIVPQEELIIYELHVGTFYRADPAMPGDFASVATKLDYLADLGVTAIEILPCTEFLTDVSWGYNPAYPYAVESSYGGVRALQQLVKIAHERGLAVIMDVVYNHLDNEVEDGLVQFDGWSENNGGGIYFYNDQRGPTQWGGLRPDFGRPEVRQYFADNAVMWLKDFQLDGLRVDSVHNMYNWQGHDDDPEHAIPEGWQALQQIAAAAQKANPHAHLIAEGNGGNAALTQPLDQQGAGFQAQWDFWFVSEIRKALETADDSKRNLQSIADCLAARHNNNMFAKVMFLESHDADANGRCRLNEEISPGHADSLFARRRSMLGAGLLFTVPATPMLFQGQEFLEDGCFDAMSWKALDWTKTKKHAGMVRLYKDLIALRRNKSGTTRGLMGQGYELTQFDNNTKVLVYHRWHKGGPQDSVVVVANFTNQPLQGYSVSFPQPGVWKTRFNSDWDGYGPGLTNTATPDITVGDNKAEQVSVGPYSVVILSQD